MKFLALLALVLPAMAAPHGLISIQKYNGQTLPGSYIVKLKPGVDKDAVVKQFGSSITHGEWSVLNAFAGKFGKEALLTLRGLGDVEAIAEDGLMRAAATQQGTAPWGLQRISQKGKLEGTNATALTYSYDYDESAGEGVDIFIVGV